MRPTDNIKNTIKNMDFKASDKLKEKMLSDVLNAKKQPSAETSQSIWRIIMKSKTTKFASAAAVIIIAMLGISFFDRSASVAWAMEETIKALEQFNAVHIIGIAPGENNISNNCQIWVRADKAGKLSGDVLVKGESGIVNLVRDNLTYTYLPDKNTVYFENAKTIGFSQWLGPELLGMLAKARNSKTHYEKDDDGRDLVILEVSITDAHGPQSWIFKFDARTKLPVTFKQWPNLYKMGMPSFWAKKITFYEDLPDDIFDFEFPNNALYVEKPLTIPEELLGLLNNPKDGVSAEGLTQLQACRKILQELWQAVINNDLSMIKKLCPVSQKWGDEFMKEVIIRQGKDDQVVEVLEIGSIVKVGNSKLGPLLVVPSRLKCKDQTVWKEDMIIQFRQIDGVSSCVVHGPYGLTTQIE